MLYVNQKDHELERWSLQFFCSTTEFFSDTKWRQDKQKTAIWDFVSDDNQHLDVKVRDIKSTDYPDYFLSEEKYEDSLYNQCFILYVFKGDRKMVLFDLTQCNFIKKENQTIHHRRADKDMTGTVYKVPSNQAVYVLDVPVSRRA